MDRAAFAAACRKIGLALDDRQLAAFEVFEASLYEANTVMNLTRVPRGEAWIRHFLDSLLIHDLIPADAQVLDIGAGPGFPSWPLACARPDLRVTALDSSGKMTGFLGRHRLPNLEVVTDRAETWGRREAYDIVTGRAVAPLGIQLELSAPACRVGGRVVPMRTPNDLREIESMSVDELGLKLETVEQRAVPQTGAVRVFPIYRKGRRTPAKYPRAWAEIRKRPLFQRLSC